MKSELGLKAHKRRCDGVAVSPSLKCGTCSKVVKSLAGMAKHKKRVRDEASYVCDGCGQVCRSKSGLGQHKKCCDGTPKKGRRRAEPTVEELTCMMCERVFKTRGGLSNHRLACGRGGGDFGCGECGKKYGSARSLASHRLYCGMSESEKVKCAFCPRLFRRGQDARVHGRWCSENPDRAERETARCERCGNTYTVRGMATHRRRCKATVARSVARSVSKKYEKRRKLKRPAEAVVEAVAEAVAEPEAEPEAEPVAEPEAEAGPKKKKKRVVAEAPEADPVAEPVAEAGPKKKKKRVVAEPEAEPVAEAGPKKKKKRVEVKKKMDDATLAEAMEAIRESAIALEKLSAMGIDVDETTKAHFESMPALGMHFDLDDFVAA